MGIMGVHPIMSSLCCLRHNKMLQGKQAFMVIFMLVKGSATGAVLMYNEIA